MMLPKTLSVLMVSKLLITTGQFKTSTTLAIKLAILLFSKQSIHFQAKIRDAIVTMKTKKSVKV